MREALAPHAAQSLQPWTLEDLTAAAGRTPRDVLRLLGGKAAAMRALAAATTAYTTAWARYEGAAQAFEDAALDLAGALGDTVQG